VHVTGNVITGRRSTEQKAERAAGVDG